MIRLLLTLFMSFLLSSYLICCPVEDNDNKKTHVKQLKIWRPIDREKQSSNFKPIKPFCGNLANIIQEQKNERCVAQEYDFSDSLFSVPSTLFRINGYTSHNFYYENLALAKANSWNLFTSPYSIISYTSLLSLSDLLKE